MNEPNTDLASRTVAELRQLAAEKGIEKIYSYNKADLIEKIREAMTPPPAPAPVSAAGPVRGQENSGSDQERNGRTERREARGAQPNEYQRRPASGDYQRRDSGTRDPRRESGEGTRDGSLRITRRPQQDSRSSSYAGRGDSADNSGAPEAPARIPTLQELDSGEEAEGVLEVLTEGYGFIRSGGFLSGDDDVYVAPSQIKRFNLKTGDWVCGNKRIKAPSEKFSAVLFINSVNGVPASNRGRLVAFENLTPVFPHERLRLEYPEGETSLRIVDLLSPIGKGQRGMIVAQPKVGKTTLLKQIAKALTANYDNLKIIILLIDERPEEVTDIRECVYHRNVQVVDSTFDELPERHKKISEMVIERAKRMVENHEDVVILLDSITRLTRANNVTVTPSGRTLSGGLDPAALYMPKRFFGAARCMREGGSITILATALIETGSRLDDMVYEEFKGTGNMELVLNRKLSERRIFPAIDILKSSTRNDSLLLSREEQEASALIRKVTAAGRGEEATEQILNLFAGTKTNDEFVKKLKYIVF